MPTTPFKGLEIPVTGSLNDAWGDIFNEQVIETVDENMGGLIEKTVTTANVTLSAAEARTCILSLSGALTGDRQVTSAAQGFYFVENLTSGAFNLTLTNGVAGVVIPQSTRAFVFADTNNGVRIFGNATITNPNVMPTGSKTLFVSAAVPSGWALDTAANNYALSLVNTNGGVLSGTLDFSVVFGLTATDGHALTIAEMPAHDHDFVLDSANGGGTLNTAKWSSGTNSFGTISRDTADAGGDQAHSHPIDMRVQHVTAVIGIRQ